MKKILVISPSGKFYGSEQVLFDYLTTTRLKLSVALPWKSELHEKIFHNRLDHEIVKLNNGNLPAFYFKLFFDLLLNKYSAVYLNEAGHSRYINFLGKLFASKKFVIHVRLLEDAEDSRWPQSVSKNVEIITISKFIQDMLRLKSLQVYDPYPFSKSSLTKTKNPSPFIIGIIGRVTISKGLEQLTDVITKMNGDTNAGRFSFWLFGDQDNNVDAQRYIQTLKQTANVEFKGFQSDKAQIYNSIDCVLHCNASEPLGRIYLEAVDFLKPFVGFNSGGIGEIGKLLNLDKLLVEENNLNMNSEMLAGKLGEVHENFDHYTTEVSDAKEKAQECFNLGHYTETLDKLLAS